MSKKKSKIALIVIAGLVLVSAAWGCTSTSVLPASLPTSTPTVIPTQTPTNTIMPAPTSTPTEMPTSTCPPDSSKYGFESADVFWIPQTYIDSQAITEVAQSGKTAKFGCYSLELVVDLAGGHANKSKGEAYVDMRFYPPTEIMAPLDLEGTPITIWIYAPVQAAGDPSSPNGVQVFVKDQNWKAQYGAWFNLSGYTDKWIPLRLTPSKDGSPDGFMDSGFDPTQIIVVGLKIGTGTNSMAMYSGPIYVDGINW